MTPSPVFRHDVAEWVFGLPVAAAFGFTFDEPADDRSVTARGADPDTLVASAKAYLAALNKLMAGGARLHAQHAAE